MLALERQVPTETDRMDLGVRSAQRRTKQNQGVGINWCSGQGGPDPRLQRLGRGGGGVCLPAQREAKSIDSRQEEAMCGAQSVPPGTACFKAARLESQQQSREPGRPLRASDLIHTLKRRL